MKIAKPGFQFGLQRPLEVREEQISDQSIICRVAYISDIHLRRGRSEMLAEQIINALKRALPDIILLGGDLLDQSSELNALRQLTCRMVKIAPVYAVSGNHDKVVGEELVKEASQAGGASWINDRTVFFTHNERVIAISGPESPCEANQADYQVLCAHNPWVWRKARTAGFDLVLAGHLHGCQGVLFEAAGRLYPGAFFYPHNYIRQKYNTSTLVVSMGCSDLIPIRWGCPREILICLI